MSRESYPNLVGDLAVVKGETYRKLIETNSISFDGNLTTATLRGQIRDNYVDAGGTLLGSFAFEDSVYDAELDKTFIKPYLTEFATINLPSTNKYREGVEPNIKTTLVYDIELFIDDEIIKYAPGFVQVIGEVTGGTVSYNPAEEWTAGIDSVELFATVGFTKTYIIWGDAEKTINLGTFDVIDTQPTEGVSGFGTFAVTQSGEWDVTASLGDTVDIDGSITVENLPDFTFDGTRLTVKTELDQPLTSTQLEEIVVKVEEQTPIDLSTLATEETLLNVETVLSNPIQVTPTVFPDFNIPNHNRRELNYTGNNLTSVVYKADGVTVATLTLGYTDNVLTSVERS